MTSTTLRATLAGLAVLQSASVHAVVFTNDVVISPGNSNYDGQEIVVGNCTVTVDGPHSFASVRLTGGGVLTHTFAADGLIPITKPVADEPHALTGTNAVTLADTNVVLTTVTVTDVAGAVNYTNGTDYVVAAAGGLVELRRTEASAIPDGEMVLVSYEVSVGSAPAGLSLVVSNDVIVEAGCIIDASGRGYGGGQGTGRGATSGYPASGGGGGHGGYGGRSSGGATGGQAHGSAAAPVALGGAGGTGYGGLGGAGGGGVRLRMGGAFVLEGTVSVNGANGFNTRSGGGAGGSVWISAQTISGSGSIHAEGGVGEPSHGGGGGGGQIAIEFETNQFAGSLSVIGGAGWERGGAGTIFTRQTGTDGDVVIDGRDLIAAPTLLAVTNGANVVARAGVVVAITGDLVLGSWRVESNTSVLPAAGRLISVEGDVTIESGASVFANGRGWPGGYVGGRGFPSPSGPGGGRFYTVGGTIHGSGAGHSGYGGMSGALPGSFGMGGAYYGSVSQPASAGSGGGGTHPSLPGGAGGGVVRLMVGGTLHLDGSIEADGQDTPTLGCGGGSGGSIWLTVGTITGSGRISADGGSAVPPHGGGGSGGRIAIYYDTNDFAGTISAIGGSGYGNGAAGTIYTKASSISVATLLLDNREIQGTNTFLTGAGPNDLTIRGGAVASGLEGIRNLLVASSGGIKASSISCSGNAVIEQGVLISEDGTGLGPNEGSGRGIYLGSSGVGSGGGGGFGGYGGNGLRISATQFGRGGTAAGLPDMVNANTRGSGGGGITSGSAQAGSGGGWLVISTQGSLHLDGTISANGTPGLSGGAGGGSGGGVGVSAEVITGSGSIFANGGSGHLPNGGGGGGGRIVLRYGTHLFTGTISAKGGVGATTGGAGTIYFDQTSTENNLLLADNGGQSGTNTSLSGLRNSTDVELRGGARGHSPYPSILSLRSLTIRSNGCLFARDPTQVVFVPTTIIVHGDLLIEKGGVLSGDGQGSGFGLPWSGRYDEDFSSGGGGGHGGYGGSGYGNQFARGGWPLPTTSLIFPTTPGYSGGYHLSGSPAPLGGGALKLTVEGSLTVNGSLSSDGSSGFERGAGGGAGGSLWITAGSLSGAGRISVDGGGGYLPNGGGGGGGRMALYFGTNDFAGTISAKGGLGFVTGGAGTIYLKPNDAPLGHLLVDNEGRLGTNTLVLEADRGDLTVSGGAIAVLLASSTNVVVGDLTVASGGMVLLSNQVLTINGDAVVTAGGRIAANGLGHGPGLGPGTGQSATLLGSGASHGGLGGLNLSESGYGSVQEPSLSGSGGQNAISAWPGLGGRGGGVVRMVMPGGSLRVDGKISADGLDGGRDSGGGSGGSVWLTVGSLTGSGVISANGGNGSNAGGGGGGRVAIHFLQTNEFGGAIMAHGGEGHVAGGAGTVFFRDLSSPVGRLLVKNAGVLGAHTPLSSSYVLPTVPFDLSISDGAVVHPVTPLPRLNNLVLAAGGQLTSRSSSTNLEVTVIGDLDVQPGGAITVDARGFARTNGPGTGGSLSDQGAGGSYGGMGGASASGALGGTNYGSETLPMDRGSGGGAGFGLEGNGSEGGGALRLFVAGVLNVDGRVSADGGDGVQDNSGGGSGGSVWVMANEITGAGLISAIGGSGEPHNGGGGGGGRIAIYSPANSFTGMVSVAGGPGFMAGGTGTVYTSSSLPAFAAISHTPSGVVSNTVGAIDLLFSGPVDAASVAANDFELSTPYGLLPTGNILVSSPWPSLVRVSISGQNAPGDYRFKAGPGIADLFGQPMSLVYTGSFSIELPTLSGFVMDTNGLPVAGASLHPSGALMPAITGGDGSYEIGLPVGWDGTVTPWLQDFAFIPGSMTYTNFAGPITNQNYLMVPTIAPGFSAMLSETNLALSWHGFEGVDYRALRSTNLLDWEPFGGVMAGSNASARLVLPVGDDPQMYFRLEGEN